MSYIQSQDTGLFCGCLAAARKLTPEEEQALDAILPSTKRYKHLALIGRIPFDDEDSCYIFQDKNLDEATEAFVQQIYEDSGRDDRERVKKRQAAKSSFFIPSLQNKPLKLFNETGHN